MRVRLRAFLGELLRPWMTVPPPPPSPAARAAQAELVIDALHRYVEAYMDARSYAGVLGPVSSAYSKVIDECYRTMSEKEREGPATGWPPVIAEVARIRKRAEGLRDELRAILERIRC